jgi:hypothetical protein
MSHLMLTVYTAVVARWAAMTDPAERERGDNPVSTAIIVAVVATAAVAVGLAITNAVTGWTAKIPQ